MSKYFKMANSAVEGAAAQEIPSLDVVLDGLQESLAAETTPAPKVEPVKSTATKLKLNNTDARLLTPDHEGSFGFAVEAIRALRTRVLRLHATKGIKSFLLTSSVEGEGKTLTTCNLGVSCAQLINHRTLLVDADLRRGGATQLLGAVGHVGLSEVLQGKLSIQDAVHPTNVPNLFVLPTGLAGEMSPPELFVASRWKEVLNWATENFKLTFIDAPPTIGLADSEILSNAVDGLLLVVRSNTAPRELVEKAVKQLDSKKLLGMIFNADQDPIHRRYHKYGYGYGYGYNKGYGGSGYGKQQPSTDTKGNK